jgi:hypothetical protein
VPFFSSTNAPNCVVLTTFALRYSSPTSGLFVRPSIAAIAASAFVPSVA